MKLRVKDRGILGEDKGGKVDMLQADCWPFALAMDRSIRILYAGDVVDDVCKG